MISKDVLEKMYVNNNMTMREISLRMDISVGTVFNYLKKYNIPTRKYKTEEQKLKISIANKGRISSRKGVSLSEDTKKKISESQKNKYRNPSRYGGCIKKRKDGYVAVYNPNHPYSTKDGFVMEHILVMEEHIGRYITREEVVHHKNKNRSDNRIENLELMTFKEHAKLHLIERQKEGKINYHKVPVINVTTGEEFESCIAAAKAYNIPATNISRVCRGKRKTCRNCEWKYKEEN